MDLTNIKPCMDCAHWAECPVFYMDGRDRSTYAIDNRIRNIFIAGEDCFKEVKSNAEV